MNPSPAPEPKEPSEVAIDAAWAQAEARRVKTGDLRHRVFARLLVGMIREPKEQS